MRVISIGELLIDFIPDKRGTSLTDVESFTKFAGGAPANVLVAASKFNVETLFIGQVGNDFFGSYLIDKLNSYNVNTKYLLKTNEYKTSLAFVSLTNEGERDFVFYRNPSADQFYQKEYLPLDVIKDDILHFCSVSLDDYPIKEAHKVLIDHVRKNKGLISFDPNIRLNLWEDHEKLRSTILEFIPLADIIKVSDDELEFITGISDYNKALESLFIGNVKHVLITKGGKGACYYNKDFSLCVNSLDVNVVDTTGAGDAFIGSFLAGITRYKELNKDNIKEILNISNITAGLTTTKHGGMDAIPSLEEINKYL